MEGNLLKSTAKCLVNPVNCEGIMGKGIALLIKQNYPKTFQNYKEACNKGKLSIGHVHTFFEEGKYIINLPTKVKWKEPSCLEYIELGLAEMIEVIKLLPIYTIAIPALGCGNGGLDWNDVKPLIIKTLEPMSDRVFHIYEPHN